MILTARRIPRIALLAAIVAAPLLGEQLVVGAADFHARKYEGHFFDGNGWVEGSLAEGGDGCLVASVRLPHDALVSQMLLQVYDARATNFSIDLRRKRRGNSVPAEVVANASTSGSSTSVTEILVPLDGGGHLVQDSFVYFLSTEENCLDGADHRIYAVRIDYELALFADGFESGDESEWSAPQPTVFSEWASGIDFKGFRGWPWTIDSTLSTFWIEAGFSGPPDCSAARLELPHGATVVGFLANLWDIRGDSNISLNLRRKTMATSTTPAVMASATTTGSGGWHLVSDFTVANAGIDNDTYWYWLDACLTGNDDIQAAELGVQSVQVLYSLP
jgi:hypothetical protein